MTIDNPTITTTNNGTIQLTSDNYINNINLVTDVHPSSETKTVNITENGTIAVTPDNGIPYLDSVIINTNVQPTEETISQTYTESGYYEIKKTDNYYLKQVNLTINIPQILKIDYIQDSSTSYVIEPSDLTITTIENTEDLTPITPENLTYVHNIALIKPTSTGIIKINETMSFDLTILKHKDGGLQIEEIKAGNIYQFEPEKSYFYIMRNCNMLRFLDSNNTALFASTMKSYGSTIDAIYIDDSMTLTQFKINYFPNY
ncbi:hypothetical protein EDI_054650 [Entamoeba dispar SAW760]|uniref:Uncharacterized protein n=1 Tax=Entamoeba dispar (strain ATCC PRA-260 / SAW760) TaxID=370354 RepID=B0EB53_ENTDS|nr:uncharacterized protein EDI_054650 [Entamoeba dispar SAW760]EDR28237.1 hypothetical protein EDI_054650 [Entamoeba dispar SAW760]|eukprot:EDR28237.1 hypothetical protein EDI_054650 [Entamoeba dispar SAW760]